ncbi:MAG: cupin domain-containing protein [Erysipelotrichaceae bacterium]|nr:cupin domain-containing protein [Erysipelotrichaceae bacterium]
MIIDLLTQQEQALPNFKGGENEIYAKMNFDGTVRIMQIRVPHGSTIGEHTHTTNSEIIFCISGEGTFICNGVKEVITAGQCHYCPMGSTHTLINEAKEDFCGYAVVPEHTK